MASYWKLNRKSQVFFNTRVMDLIKYRLPSNVCSRSKIKQIHFELQIKSFGDLMLILFKKITINTVRFIFCVWLAQKFKI